MAAISQTILWDALSLMTRFVLWLRLNWFFSRGQISNNPADNVITNYGYAFLKLFLNCIYSGVVLTRSIFFKLSQITHHTSAVRARYGVSFVDSISDLYLSQPLQWQLQYLVIFDRAIDISCNIFIRNTVPPKLSLFVIRDGPVEVAFLYH